MAGPNITTREGRGRLKVRREPYFKRIGKGQHIGYRRTEAGGTWTAKHTVGKARKYLGIGSEADLPEYADALALAVEWFRDMAVEDRPDAALTVRGAIEDYLADLGTRKSQEAAKRARQSLEKHVPTSLGRLEVAKLTTKRLKAWQIGLIPDSKDQDVVRRSKETANRVLTILKAALNRAFTDGAARSDAAWRRVKPFPGVSRAREVFLSSAQCKALLEACPADFRPLVRSALLTGARYGELTRRKVKDLDLRQGVLHIPDGKTGARDVVLSDAGIAHFKALAKDKLPAALLHLREHHKLDNETGEMRIELVEWGKSEQHRRITAAAKAAKLPAATCFYSLRHTHASIALLAGVNVQVLAENLGTSIRMIEKHYGKFMRTDRRAMFNAVQLP